VQQTAHATYREILERRAEENRIDFVNGVAMALTPLAFFEVVMNKAFRSLVDDRTEASVETGLRAAEKLQSVLDGREQGADIARLQVDLGRIIAAVKSTVPQEMWARSRASWTDQNLSTPCRSTKMRTTSTTLMRPTTRPSSTRRTTSYDLLPSHLPPPGRVRPLPVFTVRSPDACSTGGETLAQQIRDFATAALPPRNVQN